MLAETSCFSRKIVLVEGEHDKIVLPYIFELKNTDINEAGISIIDAGGKENLEFIIKIVEAFSIPFIVIHDEDKNANNYATYHDGPNGLNAKIRATVGDDTLVFIMDPNFEGILGVSGKNLREKINMVKTLDITTIPQILNNAIDKLLSISY